MTARTLAVLACAVTAAGFAPAQIAQYTFPGTTTGALLATSTAANVTATDVNFAGSSASQYSPSPQRLRVTRGPGAIDIPSAVTNRSYFSFDLVPRSGYALNLTSLTVQAATGFDPNGFVVRSSLDGYSTNLSSASVTTGSTEPAYPTFTTDLSGSAFDRVNPIITFRVYVWQPSPTGPGASFFDNLVVNGTVITTPVPEPTAMLGMSVLALGAAHRLRRRRATRTRRAAASGEWPRPAA